MAYLFKQKLTLGELVDISLPIHRILLHEPEEYLAGLYRHHLTKHNFQVEHCPSVNLLNAHILNFKPTLLVFSVDESDNVKTSANWLLHIKKQNPEIFIITTGLNTNSEILKTLLNVGVSSHINRRLSRPQDLVILAQTILKN